MTSIKLDYDFHTQRALLKFVKRVWPFCFWFSWPFGQLQIESLKIYRTKHGWHFYLTAKNIIPPRQLVFLQLAFGSDFKRECFNMRRVYLHLKKGWNVLFQTKRNNKSKLISKEIYMPELSEKVMGIVRKVNTGFVL